MPRVLHVRTDVHRWRTGETREVNRALVDEGSIPIDMDWSALQLHEDDPDHFTFLGSVAFCREFASRVALLLSDMSSPSVWVLADSTIDHNNWSDGYRERHGAASLRLVHQLTQHHSVRDVMVDAVCGSGFVARAREGEHFHARLSRHLSHPSASLPDAIVFVGGWNDVTSGHTTHRIRDAIRRCVRLAACGRLRTRNSCTPHTFLPSPPSPPSPP